VESTKRAGRPAPAFLVLFVLSGLAAAARAQDAGVVPIVVTAARAEQPLGDALPSVTVITRADIEATQSRDLVELLGRQAGLEFARSGGQGAQSSMFVRGANSNQVLVLVDGVRMNSVLDGAANLGGIATDSIERIEIARGNLSSLYGSEAIGGVVQIFTRGGAHAGAEALAEAGQGRTRDASASIGAPLGDSWVSVSAGAREQQAISAIDPAKVPFVNPATDGNRNRNGALRWEMHGPDGELRAWAWGSYNDTNWDDPYNASASNPTIASTQATQIEHATQDGVGLSGARRFGASTLRLTAAQTRDDSANVSNVPNVPGDPYAENDNSRFLSRNRLFSLQDNTTIVPGVDWAAGLEHVDQQGASTAFDPTFNFLLTGFTRRIDSAWTGTTGRLGSQQWQINLRHDRYSDAGSATTGLVGWGWWLGPSWKITAQASTAFRAPSFNELYYPTYGNSGLQPERARSEELGLRWAEGAASASVAIYRNRTTNLIEAGPPPTYVSTNIGRAAMDGSEWQAAGDFGSLHLGAALSLDRPRDLDTGLALLRRAHYSAKLTARYAAPGAWSVGADLQRSGARDDLDYLSYARVSLPAYNLARLALERDLGRHVRLQLRIENLFNAHYELIDGYNTLPRLIVLGVEATR
jgi:vitamin B12 transporter